jgi:hypothetical protein
MKEGKKVYPVRAVIGPEYVNSQDRFFFKTEWEEKKKNGEYEISNIPLENFIDTPLPIFEYGKKERQPNAGLNKILSRRVCPKEFIPTGQEFVRKIYYSFTKKIRKNKEEFYYVRFRGDKCYHFVRLLFMEYYFPRELLMYWIRNKIDGPKFIHKS